MLLFASHGDLVLPPGMPRAEMLSHIDFLARTTASAFGPVLLEPLGLVIDGDFSFRQAASDLHLLNNDDRDFSSRILGQLDASPSNNMYEERLGNAQVSHAALLNAAKEGSMPLATLAALIVLSHAVYPQVDRHVGQHGGLGPACFIDPARVPMNLPDQLMAPDVKALIQKIFEPYTEEPGGSSGGGFGGNDEDAAYVAGVDFGSERGEGTEYDEEEDDDDEVDIESRGH